MISRIQEIGSMTQQTGAGRTPSKPFSPEVRERAVRLVQEQQGAHPTQWAAIRSIADCVLVLQQSNDLETLVGKRRA